MPPGTSNPAQASALQDPHTLMAVRNLELRARAIVEENGLVQVTDEGAIEAVVDEVLAENPTEVERCKAGNEKLLGFFVGQIMKKTRGKANPQLVNDILRKKLLS